MPLQLCWGDRRLTLLSLHCRAPSPANCKSRTSQKPAPQWGPASPRMAQNAQTPARMWYHSWCWCQWCQGRALPRIYLLASCMDLLHHCPHTSFGLIWMPGGTPVGPPLQLCTSAEIPAREAGRRGKEPGSTKLRVGGQLGMPGGWHQPKPWDHLLDRGDAAWMNCPSRVSGERESDPLCVDTAQGSSALALAVGSVLSK